jgi:hypothetical protein
VDELRLPEVLGEPHAALPEGLRVRVDAVDGGEPGGARDETLRDVELELRADEQIPSDERVHRVRHRALGRVLERYDPVLGLAPGHRVEDAVERRRLGVGRGEPEKRPGGRVRERPLRAEVRDLQRVLEREAGAHHLAVHSADRLGRKAAGAGSEAVEHLALAVRIVGGKAGVALGAGDVGDDAGSLVEQREDLVVEVVDVAAMVV